MKIKYKHTNIIARDFESLSKFYQDVFGCKREYKISASKSEWLSKGTGIAGAELKGGDLLRLPGYDNDAPTLEIFTYSQQHDERKQIVANNVGLGHLAFEVENISEILEKVLENGGKKIGELVQVNLNKLILTFIYVTDPEGNIIELQNLINK